MLRRLVGAWVPWMEAAGPRGDEWANDVVKLYISRHGQAPSGEIGVREFRLEVRCCLGTVSVSVRVLVRVCVPACLCACVPVRVYVMCL